MQINLRQNYVNTIILDIYLKLHPDSSIHNSTYNLERYRLMTLNKLYRKILK